MFFFSVDVRKFQRPVTCGSGQIIIIMEICKAPTLRLKALNKHSITHIMYIEMEMLSAIKMYTYKNNPMSSFKIHAFPPLAYQPD